MDDLMVRKGMWMTLSRLFPEYRFDPEFMWLFSKDEMRLMMESEIHMPSHVYWSSKLWK
jgi:hypothetical protein